MLHQVSFRRKNSDALHCVSLHALPAVGTACPLIPQTAARRHWHRCDIAWSPPAQGTPALDPSAGAVVARPRSSPWPPPRRAYSLQEPRQGHRRIGRPTPYRPPPATTGRHSAPGVRRQSPCAERQSPCAERQSACANPHDRPSRQGATSSFTLISPSPSTLSTPSHTFTPAWIGARTPPAWISARTLTFRIPRRVSSAHALCRPRRWPRPVRRACTWWSPP